MLPICDVFGPVYHGCVNLHEFPTRVKNPNVWKLGFNIAYVSSVCKTEIHERLCTELV